MNPITSFVVAATAAIGALLAATGNLRLDIALWAGAAVISQSLKMANTWQKFVVLRAGKLQGVKGPGLFAIIPVVDSVVAVIDERIQTTDFNAEQALTRDTVPVWDRNITITTRLVDTFRTPVPLKILRSHTIDPKLLITYRFKLDRIFDGHETFVHAANTRAS